MKNIFLIILISFQLNSFSQTCIKDSIDNKIVQVEGDLNKDKLIDKVIVTQDTVNENAPYKLQVFFKESNRKFKLIATSTKVIIPQYPEGRNGYLTGNGFSDISIKNGVLSVNYQLLRGHYEYKFRYQNGNFELIGFSEVFSDGSGLIYYIDFNLSTGIRIDKTSNFDSDKDISIKKKKILIRPLPKLQDFNSLDNELF